MKIPLRKNWMNLKMLEKNEGKWYRNSNEKSMKIAMREKWIYPKKLDENTRKRDIRSKERSTKIKMQRNRRTTTK
jgi:hypothetical protein